MDNKRKARNCLLATFVASVKIILFALCVYRVIFSVTYLRATHDEVVNLDQSFTHFPGCIFHIMEICVLAICALGAYGTCSKNLAYLKLFALLIIIHSVIYFFIGLAEISESNQKFVEIMNDYAENYQHAESNNTVPNKATRVWDALQKKGLCCGLYDPTYWINRHGQVKLPRSCCLLNFKKTCGIDSFDLQHNGCLLKFTGNLTERFITVLVNCFICLLLGIFAFFLALRRDQAPVIVERSSRDAAAAGSTFVPAFVQNRPNNYQKQLSVAPDTNLNPNGELQPPSYIEH